MGSMQTDIPSNRKRAEADSFDIPTKPMLQAAQTSESRLHTCCQKEPSYETWQTRPSCSIPFPQPVPLKKTKEICLPESQY